jgi:hypothetical protein
MEYVPGDERLRERVFNIDTKSRPSLGVAHEANHREIPARGKRNGMFRHANREPQKGLSDGISFNRDILGSNADRVAHNGTSNSSAREKAMQECGWQIRPCHLLAW